MPHYDIRQMLGEIEHLRMAITLALDHLENNSEDKAAAILKNALAQAKE